MTRKELGGEYPSWTDMQSSVFSAASAYDKAPHLRNASLKRMISGTLSGLVVDTKRRKGVCRALDLGAGHGDFADDLLRAGATVVVSEMSKASACELYQKYATKPDVEVLHDPSGEKIFEQDDRFDLISCISLLHHVPDYMTFVERLTRLVADGGAIASFQDPMLYSTRGRATRAFHKAAFYLWRLGQGNIQRGLRTTVRRARGILDPTNPSDMVEYHVVRDGVDHDALRTLLEKSFEDVGLVLYWSTPSRPLQRLGELLRLETEFGLVARNQLRPHGDAR